MEMGFIYTNGLNYRELNRLREDLPGVVDRQIFQLGNRKVRIDLTIEKANNKPNFRWRLQRSTKTQQALTL